MVHGVHSSNNKQQQQQQTMKPTEGTRRVRTHAVLLLSVKCALHRRNSRLSITLTFPLQNHIIPIPSLNTLGSFALSYAADKQTDKQTDRQSQTLYPHRPTLSAWVTTTTARGGWG